MYKNLNNDCEWDPEKHHGEPCPHHEGGKFQNFKKNNNEREFKNYYLVRDNGTKSGINKYWYEIYKKEGKNVTEEKVQRKRWYDTEPKDIIITKEQEEKIKNAIENIKLDKEYRKYSINDVYYDAKNIVNNIFGDGFYSRETSAIVDYFYDEIKEKYDKYFEQQVQEGQEVLNKFNKIQGEHTYEQDLKAVNSENFKKSVGTKDYKKFHENCQSCVQAYVLRRMGYDVEAKGLEDENKLTKVGWTYAMFIQTDSYFKSYKSYENGYRGEKLQSLGNRVKTQHKNIKSIVENDKDGSMYYCVVKWARSKNSHVFVIEKQNGQIRFVDPQDGSNNVEHYFEKDFTGWYIIDPNYTSLTKIENFDISKYADVVVKNK